MLPNRNLARARDDLQLAAELLTEHSNRLFYEQRYLSWRDAEIKIQAIRQLVSGIDALLPRPRLSLPGEPPGLPHGSPARSDRRSLAPLDKRSNPEPSLPVL